MLEDLLVKFDLTKDQLNKRGRVAKEIVKKRSALIEVKAQWALNQEGVIARLALSQKIATDNGWSYQTWTEKELGL